MGAGIAQVCLQAGLEVIGREVEPELGEAARGRIDHYLSRGVEKGRLSGEEKDAALARLCLITDLAELSPCHVVIEAVFEDLGVKRETFAELDRIGIDVHVHASEALHGALCEDRMAPPERLLEMQDAGHLGRKSGQGFYTY